jgi:hypothetical protein
MIAEGSACPYKQMHMNLGMMGRDFTPKQYFDHCATIFWRA